MEHGLTTVLGYLVPLIEACGAAVIVLEVLRAIISYLIAFFKRDLLDATTLRLRLGQGMVMGLEFQVAADILKTALSPAWNDILLLAALIALRTILNFLLERELRALDTHKATGSPPPSARPSPQRRRQRPTEATFEE